MASKFKARLRRNRRRQRAIVRKAEQRKQIQESASMILAEADRLIVRLLNAISEIEEARTAALLRTLASIKN